MTLLFLLFPPFFSFLPDREELTYLKGQRAEKRAEAVTGATPSEVEAISGLFVQEGGAVGGEQAERRKGAREAPQRLKNWDRSLPVERKGSGVDHRS